tara:strand:- start:1147 stop:1326 length:180 start_codon:yes stop_codon:yes gene_type:complete
MKINFIFLFLILLLNSCSQINEELPVAGELICTAAGVERDECVKAAKINNEDGNNESEN